MIHLGYISFYLHMAFYKRVLEIFAVVTERMILLYKYICSIFECEICCGSG